MLIMYNHFVKILVRVFHMFVVVSLKAETKGGYQVERGGEDTLYPFSSRLSVNRESCRRREEMKRGGNTQYMFSVEFVCLIAQVSEARPHLQYCSRSSLCGHSSPVATGSEGMQLSPKFILPSLVEAFLNVSLLGFPLPSTGVDGPRFDESSNLLGGIQWSFMNVYRLTKYGGSGLIGALRVRIAWMSVHHAHSLVVNV